MLASEHNAVFNDTKLQMHASYRDCMMLRSEGLWVYSITSFLLIKTFIS